MANWIDPVYDRVQADIDNRTSKAFWNVADWLRVNGDARIVNALTNIMLGLAIPFTELTQPTTATVPTASDINTFIANIDAARAAVCFPSASGVVALKTDWQEGNGAAAPDWQAVNAWEQDLQYIRDYLQSSANWLIDCGVARCGQSHLFQARFRVFGGYVKDKYQPGRRPRTGLAAGTGLTRQNRWRSSADPTHESIRAGVSICGAGLTRQNKWRRY